MYLFPRVLLTNYHKLGGLKPGVPSPGLWTGIGSWPIKNRVAQQEVSGGLAS